MADISRALPVDINGRRYQGVSGKLPHGTQFGASDYADAHVILKSEGHDPLLSGPNAATDTFANPNTASIISHLMAWVPGNGSWERLQSVSGALKSVLAAGSAIIGKVGIDQTTPGTTDSVSVATGQGAGAVIGAATSAAKVITDATGTVHQYLRGLVYLRALVTDQTLNRLLVLPKYNYTYSTNSVATTNLKASAGVVHSVAFTPVANMTVSLYDTATTTTGSPIFTCSFPATLLSSGPVCIILDAAFSNGLAWAMDANGRGSVYWI